MQRSYLLTVSQLRIQASIELLLKKTLVAAKIWVSRYPVSLIIIHTNASKGRLRRPLSGRYMLNPTQKHQKNTKSSPITCFFGIFYLKLA